MNLHSPTASASKSFQIILADTSVIIQDIQPRSRDSIELTSHIPNQRLAHTSRQYFK